LDKLKALQVFREAAHAGSFSAASEKLDLAQSAVSRYISSLEQWLGVNLFQRTTRNVQLTDLGRDYLKRIELILDSVQDLERRAEDLQANPSGTINVTVPVDYCRYYLEPFLEKFIGRYPQVNVSLLIVDRVVNLIEEGMDLAIRIGDLGNVNLVAKPLGEMRLKLVASPGYLAKSGPLTKPQDLSTHNCLLNAVVGYKQDWKFHVAGKELSIPARGNVIINSGDLVSDMAKRGMGVAYLPDIYLNEAIERGELVWLLPDTVLPAVPISALFVPDRHISTTLRLFIDELLAYTAT
jgi:DNA-binding transcriptional LysR family regulator